MVERTNSVKAALPGRRRGEQPGYHSPLMLLRPILAAVLCLCPWVLTACPPAEMTPCFPPASSSVTDEGAATPGRLERPALDWEIDKLPALTDAPEGDPHQLASDTFVKAQNILRKMPGKCELIRESEAEAFAEEFEKEIQQHEKAG